MTTPTRAHGPDTGRVEHPGGDGDPRTGAVVLGRYELREQVGGRESGAVWRAHDLLLRRDVALRTLRTSHDRDPARARWRAHHEGRAAAQVHHPCLAALYDMADLDGDVVLVSEFLRGLALEAVVAGSGPLPPPLVASFGQHLAGGLAVAHAGGVLHGEVTPATVLLGLADDGTPDGTGALSDFGVAGIDPAPGGRVPGPFVAPEVAHGAQATPASDVWSLAATLATAVEGHPPFGPAGPAPLRRAGVLGGVLLAALDPDPRRRPDARRVRAELEAISDAADGTAGDTPDGSSGGAADSSHAGAGPLPVPAAGTAYLPIDGEAHTAPQARVPAAVAHPPTRTWTPRTDPRPPARARRRLVGAGVVGAGLLAVGTAGAVAVSISETASTTTALPAPGPQALTAPAPVVTAPITPADPAPPITAVPMEADPLLTAASGDTSDDRRGSDDDRDRRSDRDRDRDSDDRDSDDRDDKKDRDSDEDRDSDRHDSDRGDSDDGGDSDGGDSDD